MKKEALEDHLGAVLERSWLVLGAVLGAFCYKKNVLLLGQDVASDPPKATQDRPKIGPSRILKPYFFKHVIFENRIPA